MPVSNSAGDCSAPCYQCFTWIKEGERIFLDGEFIYCLKCGKELGLEGICTEVSFSKLILNRIRQMILDKDQPSGTYLVIDKQKKQVYFIKQ